MSQSGGTSTRVLSLQDVPQQHWEALARKRIFFGHRSVGNNILEGVREVLAQHPQIHLELVEATGPGDYPAPALGHALLGKNGDPDSKVEHFASLMDGGLGNAVDIALFKYCYVDFSHESDIQGAFETYQETMDRLIATYPRTKFVYVSVPLRSTPVGLKARAKDLLKKAAGSAHSLDHNQRRNEFNAMISSSISEHDALLDLALVESTLPDGTRSGSRRGEDFIYTMAPAYTTDGGHLSAEGRRRAAEHFLAVLAMIAAGAE